MGRGHGQPQAVVSILPQSVPTGRVSYRPVWVDINPGSGGQRSEPPAAQAPPVKVARGIAISSGKGGVGKSNIAVNLAVAMSGLGLRVCLLDADLGLPNADVLCNLAPRVTLHDVVTGKCRLADAMLLAPGGFRLIPGASGVLRMANLNEAPRRAILEQLEALDRVADVILIDCGAGISMNVLAFASAAGSVVIATTPEPTAMTDAYAMIKSLAGSSPATSVSLVVNMVYDDFEGERVHARIDRVCRAFLNRTVRYAGSIPDDPAVTGAVRMRMPFVLHSPDSLATRALRELARNFAEVADLPICGGESPAHSEGFFTRLALRLGILEPLRK